MSEQELPDARTWLDAFARELGVDAPGDETVEVLLALAGVAAHSSERKAAPIACWLAAHSDTPPARALELARALRAENTD